MSERYLAVVDLGAESGRVHLARYDGQRLTLEEVHRFANGPVALRRHLYWNVLALWQEVISGLRKARRLAGRLDSIGVDTWGVDYALLDDQGLLLGLPFHYRDRRTEGLMEEVFARVPREEIYAQTGIQFMPINTLYQLLAHQREQPHVLETATHLLLMPDLFHYWLSGERLCEYTNATTTQCWSVPQGTWASDLLARLGLPTHFLPPVVAPGTPLGKVQGELAEDLGRDVLVIAPATHDTAAAVAGIPMRASPRDRAYISSGTWSLVGLELPQPQIAQGSASNFTNEGGIFGTIRFLRNVMGLWLLQECRRSWQEGGQSFSYEQLLTLAEGAPAWAALFDPDHPLFLPPGDMPTRIREQLSAHGQPVPAAEDIPALVRAILDSLILRYRQVLELAASITGSALQTIHIVGGGAQNRWLNQGLADATGLVVIAGPIEATAQGNALLQLVGLGELRSLEEVRTLAARSTVTQTFLPDPERRAAWDEAYARFTTLFPLTRPLQ
ncbi:MAG: rhamnulokinase [Thermogemmatispora sp.]|uniref:rhamnulokinase n=1 Tax=Thermogemmatispora sp. TaxID=1968838 RepID=UPI002618DAE9|nr:rhamnulokinase [Thermogemmatispora sp.]MBX5456443.1 rhamnulokinase [Thermogemmatispora sp.]